MPDLIRNAPQKPAKGTAWLTSHQRRKDRTNAELTAKAKVRRRDIKCRWPRCECRTMTGVPLECAHILDKSLGGENTTANMMLLCRFRHQGKPSLHSKDLRIEPQTSAGADGLCDFYADIDGEWVCIASERLIGVSVERGR